MNSYLLRNLSGITSASIEKYLLFTGWVRDDTFNSTRMWVFKSKSDPEFKIAVPASEKATDFYPQVYNLIQTLSVVDGKTEQEIIDSLKSASDRQSLSKGEQYFLLHLHQRMEIWTAFL